MLKTKFAILAAAILFIAAAQGAERVPVLLELFTSEGCSSCPPADQLLEKIDQDQPVPEADLIVLSEHVDYWNRIGWNDPYSSNDFSRRQQAYAAQFGTADIFTPQLIVDGEKGVVGGNWPAAARAIEQSLRETKIPVKLSAAKSADGARVHIEVPSLQNDGGKRLVYLVLAANHAKSKVTGGENGGRELNHVAVVLSMRQVAKVSAKEGISKDFELALSPKFDASDMRVVVFVESSRTRRVMGVARTRKPERNKRVAWRASKKAPTTGRDGDILFTVLAEVRNRRGVAARIDCRRP
jgi:hypothetical protein